MNDAYLSNDVDCFNYPKIFETSKDANNFNYPTPFNSINNDLITNTCKNSDNDTYSTNSTVNYFTEINKKAFNSWGYSVNKPINNNTQKTGYIHSKTSNNEKAMDLPDPIHYKEIFKSNI